MAQIVFTFHSPVEPIETVEMIKKAVSSLEGKTKLKGNVLVAKWRISIWNNFTKFNFYIGKNEIRVTTEYWKSITGIKWERKCKGVFATWNGFVKSLLQLNSDFDLETGNFHIVSAKIVSDGVEQEYSSTSKTKPSIGGALVGGALFGGVGAIVGASRSKTTTWGSSTTVFSGYYLVAVRYSNGLCLEGEISKKSSVYNQIVANMDRSDR